MGELILLTGGVRCGKNRFAERLSRELGGAYVATAEAGDDEMRAKIEAHIASRRIAWRTLEAPSDVASAIAQASERPEGRRIILVDCLTMLVSNLMLRLAGDAAAKAFGQVEAVRKDCRTSSAIVVCNEVGWGVVPTTTLGRRHRDLLGAANQTLADAASRFCLLVAGVAVDVKALAAVTSKRGAWP